MANSEYAIDIRDIEKTFGNKQVVNKISLQVKYGEIFGFLGPNGAGKTTCIRMMCGLLTPDSGEGTCLGYDIRKQSHLIKRKSGYMTQRFSMWEDLTIRENLDFVARMYELPGRNDVVDKALKQMGLIDRADQLAGSLSGGWKQRLSLASCMLHEPELLLLDEPTAGVDPKARKEFWEEINRLAAKGIAVLVSTHYMDEAERCHKLAYIAQGQLIAAGTSEEIISSQNLVTFSIRGPKLTELAIILTNQPNIQQVVAFGNELRVSGKILTKENIAKLCDSSHAIQQIATNLEDVFVYLMDKNHD